MKIKIRALPRTAREYLKYSLLKRENGLKRRKFKQADITFKTCGIRGSNDIRKGIRRDAKKW